MKKIFVLDTNVLLHHASSIEAFEENLVILPMIVIEELDKFKNRNDELGRNAREAIRRLDSLRGEGDLTQGVPLNNGGHLKIIAKAQSNSSGLDLEDFDNLKIQIAYDLFVEYQVHIKQYQIICVTKNITTRLKAHALGLEVMDFEYQKVDMETLFTGIRTLEVAPEMIEKMRKKETVEEFKVYPNEFVEFRNSNENPAPIARFLKKGMFSFLPANTSTTVWNIHSKNREQRLAIELLMDPSVQLVTLIGAAGSGKTLLALAAGLETMYNHRTYDKILVSRPIVPLGKDLGYLPGDKDEKFAQWMLPIFDNLHLLLDEGKSRGNQQSIQQKIEKLIKSHVLELEPLTYIRGRSISNQYVIIDEAQNLTPHEVKTIISRAGEGTKIVLTGDPYQIDNPYLDSSSNGLTYAVEKFKNQSIQGHITFQQSERSRLAALAASLL